jgi:hypothetical protein
VGKINDFRDTSPSVSRNISVYGWDIVYLFSTLLFPDPQYSSALLIRALTIINKPFPDKPVNNFLQTPRAVTILYFEFFEKKRFGGDKLFEQPTTIPPF